MKKITLLLSFMACVVLAQAQTLLVEDFNYTAATDLLSQGGWAVTGTNAAPTLTVTASTITYPGYPSSGIGNEVSINTGQDLNKTFTPQTTGTIYTSFIVNVSAANVAGDYFFNMGAETIGTAYFGRVFAKTDATSKLAFGIQYTSGGTIVPTYSGFDYNLNTTYLIVLKYVIDGATSNTSIIVNPVMGSTEPTTGWLNDAQGTQGKPANIGSVALRQGSASVAGTLKLDGIRVTSSWAALFTATGVSTPSANAFSAIVAGKNLLVRNAANGSTVEIFSALGAKVQSSSLVNGSVGINNLTKGLYIVRVGKNTQKIML